MKLRLLDLFCGAGGAGMGYHRAGFEVVGVDIKPQKNYPFEFHQADAFEFLEQHGHEFDVIHASPPCQAYSRSTPKSVHHPDLIADTRAGLQRISRTYVIENVEGAPMQFPITLCGTMFGLQDVWHLRRHRLFESSIMLLSLGGCSCREVVTGQVTGHIASGNYDNVRHRMASYERAQKMMGIDWMDKKELVQAIPPAYTEWIGQRLLEALACESDRRGLREG